jgi:RND superfamily putative drug exporter
MKPLFKPSRLLALASIAVAVAALLVLRLGSQEHRVTVAPGAHAGQLTLKHCTYAGRPADCGTLVVPENRHSPHSRLIALPVTRVHARAAHPAEPIFRLQGGPGISNMSFEDARRFVDDHDVVLVGYRGVDSSERLDCPEVDSARAHARGFLTSASYAADAAAFRACADRLRGDGVDLAGYSLVQRADDLDTARRALGYSRIDLLSESAGTRTAMIYAWRYPNRVHRSVMLGVNPPGHFLWDAKTTGEQVRRYARLCATDPSCPVRGDLGTALQSAFRDVPSKWWFLPVRPGNVRAAAFFGLMNTTTEGGGPLSGPWTIDTMLAADRGDASGAWLLSVMAQLLFPRAQVWGEVAATARTDVSYARPFFAAHADRGSLIGSPGADLIWAGGRLVDAWPATPDANEYSRVRNSKVDTLLIGGALDFATPPQWATRDLLPHLPDGHQVVLPGLGHTDDIWSYEPKASTHLITTFLDSGRVDTSLYTPNRVDFSPAFSHSTIAKIVLGVMAGLSGLTALSLLWLPARARWGRRGRKSRTVVRTLYAPVLGLGGWFGGVLIVLAKLPTVPIDDPVLSGVSIGVPVGLAVYCAWVDRAWSRRTRRTGLAAAVAAALVGAWLGAGATDGLFAVLTGAIGATAAANLILLVLDVVRESGATTSSSEPATRPAKGGITMSAVPQYSGLAARMGRWSAANWKKATFGWLAFTLVAFAVGGAVGLKNIDSNAPGPGESGRMDKILDAGFKQPAGESVLIQSRSARSGDPAFKAAVGDVIARVSKQPAAQHVHRGATSPDGHSVLVDFKIRGDKSKAVDNVQPVVDSVAAVQRAHPGFYIGEFGDASSEKGVSDAYLKDLGKAGMFSLPVTLIILVLTFGALVAAGIPLLLALTAVFATFGLVAIPSHLVPVAMEAPAMVLLIGLAVGVDYSLFYLKRERQERAAGRSPEAALAVAAATSGRSVLISGLTVMTAMAGMLLTGNDTFSSLAVATILVVAVAVLGSLTVLPAVLSRLGDKVDRLRLPLVGRRRRDDGSGGIWGSIVDRVLRRPALSATLAGGLLLILAAPALQLHLAAQGTESFPKSLHVMKTYDRMQQGFPGSAMPANVVVKAPSVKTPAMQRAISELERRAVASGRAFNPITVDVNKQGTVADITIPIAGNGTNAASNAAFDLLRNTLVPQTVGAVPDSEAGVTGRTAGWRDQADELKSNLLPVVGFVLLLAFGLMLVAFRSVVVAVKAIVLNLLSVAAAYGVMVMVFQHGWGAGLIGAGSSNGIEVVVPLLLFVILFGLSMDYHVFIISRIREAFDRGEKMDDAVAHGIKSTAGVVTSAAIVMVLVFSVFATLSIPFFKQFGIGLAAAILIDATIVRAVLLPATMKLLGNWNWYLPRWLDWLPRLHGEEPAPAVPATPVSA